MLQLRRAIFSWLQHISRRRSCIGSELLPVLKHVLNVTHSCSLADDNVVTVDNRTRINNAIVVKLVVGAKLHTLSLAHLRSLEDLIFLLGV